MRVISSRSMLVFYKYLALPMIWFLLIVLFAVMGPIAMHDEHDKRGVWALAAFALLAVVVSVGYLWRGPRLMKPFADEVQDAGDALIVRKSGNQMRIPFADITSMGTRFIGRGSMYFLLTLRAPCDFGSQVAFFPINNGSRFLDGTPWRSRRPPLYDDLTNRINQARQPVQG